MKFMNFVLMTFVLIFSVKASPHHKYEAKLRELSADMETLKASHQKEIAILKKEVEELKQVSVIYETDNHERNEQATLEWAKRSMEELRVEVREIRSDVNNSVLLRQLHVIRNELKQALKETSNVSQLARTQESRIDKLDSEVGRLKYEGQQCRESLAQLRAHFTKLSTEIKQVESINADNAIVEPHEIRSGELKLEPTHKYRHNKMMHTQIARLARNQEQVEEYQQNLQTQLLDVQRRLDRFEEPNWNLLSAQVEFLQLESKMYTSELKNISLRLSDFDKVHVSMLELREDVESIENKVDKTIPEFRKEISKLDVHVAQLTAQSSYLKEDQDNLRQSVKAIAVSVSNNMDRAEIDRDLLKKINDSVNVLTAHSKQHFHRLNDHILKSEAMIDSGNATEIVPLPELMGEVKELEPVQHEYLELVNQLPRDCTSIAGPEGIYLIHPGREPIETWCVNGNTVIQRRYNGSVEFNRKFVAYEHGFGNPASEYWIGLQSMHQLTADNCSSMRIDMTDIYGASWYAQYDRFYVGDSDSGYILEVNGFKGNASDAFEYQNKMEFSAIDRDRDISNTHCAGNYEGGWWFSHCQHVNINGKYTLGLTWFDGARNEWIAVATTEMRLFRRPGCA